MKNLNRYLIAYSENGKLEFFTIYKENIFQAIKSAKEVEKTLDIKVLNLLQLGTLF